MTRYQLFNGIIECINRDTRVNLNTQKSSFISGFAGGKSWKKTVKSKNRNRLTYHGQNIHRNELSTVFFSNLIALLASSIVHEFHHTQAHKYGQLGKNQIYTQILRRHYTTQ